MSSDKIVRATDLTAALYGNFEARVQVRVCGRRPAASACWTSCAALAYVARPLTELLPVLTLLPPVQLQSTVTNVSVVPVAYSNASVQVSCPFCTAIPAGNMTAVITVLAEDLVHTSVYRLSLIHI